MCLLIELSEAFIWAAIIPEAGNSNERILCIPGNYLMKLVERMPRVCKAVIKAKGGYFEESQI